MSLYFNFGFVTCPSIFFFSNIFFPILSRRLNIETLEKNITASFYITSMVIMSSKNMVLLYLLMFNSIYSALNVLWLRHSCVWSGVHTMTSQYWIERIQSPNLCVKIFSASFSMTMQIGVLMALLHVELLAKLTLGMCLEYSQKYFPMHRGKVP